jgi:putative hydrolase of the HAD superfamily
MVDAVIFDWGGTLTPWHTVDVREAWRLVAHAVDPETADEVAGRLHDAEMEVWTLSRNEHRSSTLTEVFAAAGLAPTEAALVAHEAVWEPHTMIDPEVPAMLAGLRERGIRVGVLSNTIWHRDHHERVFARDGVLELLDGAVYTSEIPWTKPDPRAFRAAMGAIGVTDPGRCVFVGDRLFDDIWGANRVGMRTIFIPHTTLPAGQRGHSEGAPDAVVHRLGEVLEVVDSWR